MNSSSDPLSDRQNKSATDPQNQDREGDGEVYKPGNLPFVGTMTTGAWSYHAAVGLRTAVSGVFFVREITGGQRKFQVLNKGV